MTTTGEMQKRARGQILRNACSKAGAATTVKKSASPADRELKIGDRIYWDGDMANPPHRYEVLALPTDRWGSQMRLRDLCDPAHCDDAGRELRTTPALVYSPRWGWQDEKDAARAAVLAEMQARLGRKP